MRDDEDFCGKIIIHELGGPMVIVECECDVDAVLLRLRF